MQYYRIRVYAFQGCLHGRRVQEDRVWDGRCAETLSREIYKTGLGLPAVLVFEKNQKKKLIINNIHVRHELS